MFYATNFNAICILINSLLNFTINNSAAININLIDVITSYFLSLKFFSLHLTLINLFKRSLITEYI